MLLTASSTVSVSTDQCHDISMIQGGVCYASSTLLLCRAVRKRADTSYNETPPFIHQRSRTLSLPTATTNSPHCLQTRSDHSSMYQLPGPGPVFQKNTPQCQTYLKASQSAVVRLDRNTDPGIGGLCTDGMSACVCMIFQNPDGRMALTHTDLTVSGKSMLREVEWVGPPCSVTVVRGCHYGDPAKERQYQFRSFWVPHMEKAIKDKVGGGDGSLLRIAFDGSMLRIAFEHDPWCKLSVSADVDSTPCHTSESVNNDTHPHPRVTLDTVLASSQLMMTIAHSGV